MIERVIVLDDEVHADDVRRVPSVTVKHHGGSGLEPNKLPALSYHSVVPAHPLTTGLNCTEEKDRR